MPSLVKKRIQTKQLEIENLDEMIWIALLSFGIPNKPVVATDLGRKNRIQFFGLQHFKFQLVESK